MFVLPASCRPLGLRTEDFLGPRRDKMNAGAGLADIDPMTIDQSVSQPPATFALQVTL